MLIAIGVLFQILQIVVTVIQRRKHSVGSDPWDARTLEWSTVSPPPHYNFAILPEVSGRDAFWEMKQQAKTGPKTAIYETIHMPKNTSLGLWIALFAGLFAYAMIWRLWWLAILGFVGIVTTIIIRTAHDDTEHALTAKQLSQLEAKYSEEQNT